MTLPLDQVLIGDCVAEMEKMPARSVDIIFADPPYNLQLSGELRRPNNTRVDGVDAAWDRFAGSVRPWFMASRSLRARIMPTIDENPQQNRPATESIRASRAVLGRGEPGAGGGAVRMGGRGITGSGPQGEGLGA